MKLTIESTDRLTTIDGVPVRVWNATTPKGIPVRVFVHRIAVHGDRDATELEAELVEQLPPSRYYPLKEVLP